MNLLVWLDAPLITFGLFALCPPLWTWLLRSQAIGPPLRGRPLQMAMTGLFYLGLGSLGMAACDVGLAAWEFERGLACEEDSKKGTAEQRRDPRLQVMRWFAGCENSVKRSVSLPIGAEAPDFTLPSVEDDRAIRLSDFRGHKPVVLIFGSFG